MLLYVTNIGIEENCCDDYDCVTIGRNALLLYWKETYALKKKDHNCFCQHAIITTLSNNQQIVITMTD